MSAFFAVVSIMLFIAILWSRENMWFRQVVVGGLSLVAGVCGLVHITYANDEVESGSQPNQVSSQSVPVVQPTTKTDSPTPLAEEPSSAPNPTIIIPPGRPNWVESAPSDDGGVHLIAVTSGPHQRKRECDTALNVEISSAVEDYINDHIGDSIAATVIHYDLKEIKNRLIRSDDYYYETVIFQFGPMQQSHALLRFDDSFRVEIDQKWQQISGAGRLLKTGLMAIGALAFVATLFGYLRVDTATKGYYTGRLQLATVATILALVAVGVVVGNRFSDLLLYFL